MILAGGNVISSVSTTKKIILCIDDDEGILHYLKALLERSGYAVLTAASARQGLSLMTMCNCDMVLLDYEMPEMNGHDLASEIKRIRPELMVVLLSGYDVPTHTVAVVDAFLPKLEAPRQLVAMIAELCNRTASRPPVVANISSDRTQNA
jgi:DNA-binding response OmpR family regulator